MRYKVEERMGGELGIEGLGERLVDLERGGAPVTCGAVQGVSLAAGERSTGKDRML